MFDVLNDCFFKHLEPPQAPSKSVPLSVDQDEFAIPANLNLPDSFKYMTLTEAAKQHKMFDKSGKPIGDIETAYKCFEECANYNQTNASNQIKAK